MPAETQQQAAGPAAATTVPYAPAGEPQIHVIPAKFYGAALKTKPEIVSTVGSKKDGPSTPKRSSLPIIIVIVLLLVIAGVGGYFIYTNRDALLGAQPAPAPAQVATTTEPKSTPPPPPPPPSAPSNLSATSTGPRSVTLNWSDTSDNESAFRIERRTEDNTVYSMVTNLPPNSTIFQDNSVQASTTYFYRIIARNDSGESQSTNEAQVTTQALPPPPPVQPKLPPAGLDTDSDGLSDLEESIFQSDPRNPDIDGDGFLDGNEVFNLYNPNGRAPAKLVDSGLIKEISGDVGWSMFIPKDWTVSNDLADGSRATIDLGHGEKFYISIEKNDQNLPIVDWFMRQNPSAEKGQIMVYRSKGGYEGIIGPDLLTTYIPWDHSVFVFRYDMNGQSFINYRTVYSMVLNSLKLQGLTTKMVPAGTGQLPFEPAASTQGVVTEPVSVTGNTSSSSNADSSIFPSSQSTSSIQSSPPLESLSESSATSSAP